MTDNAPDDEPIDDAPDDASDALVLSRPDAPTTFDELALHGTSAVAILETRHKLIATSRRGALTLTFATDWVRELQPSGVETLYLSDVGCQRIRGFLGVEIENLGPMERITLTEPPGAFLYVVSGDGFHKLTGQRLRRVEGGRASTERFCQDVQGAERELKVRKAARANLDGRITRSLGGVNAVPRSELDAIFKISGQRIEDCAKGHGFGTQDERVGGMRADDPAVPPPVCAVCGKTAKYRQGRGTRGPFYGCPDYEKHPDKKWTVDAADWIAKSRAAIADAPARVEPPPVDEVFGDKSGRKTK
jgi:hypothetical protein